MRFVIEANQHTEDAQITLFESGKVLGPLNPEKDRKAAPFKIDRSVSWASPLTLPKDKWAEVAGVDRVRKANFLAKQPWCEVRVTVFTKDEPDAVENFSADVLDPAITGAAAVLDAGKAAPAAKK